MLRKSIVVFAGALIFCGCTNEPSSTSAPTATTLESAQQKVAQSPSYENYIGLGLELAKVNRNQEAVVAYYKAIDINPKAPVAWNNLCFEQTNQGKYADAVQNCEKSLSFEKDFVLAQNNLKVAQQKLADLKKYLGENKKTLLSKPGLTGNDILNIGLQFDSAAQHKEAIEIYMRIKPQDPSYGLALNNIAFSYASLKDFKSAEKTIAEAKKVDPNNQLIENNRKWISEQASKQQ